MAKRLSTENFSFLNHTQLDAHRCLYLKRGVGIKSTLCNYRAFVSNVCIEWVVCWCVKCVRRDSTVKTVQKNATVRRRPSVVQSTGRAVVLQGFEETTAPSVSLNLSCVCSALTSLLFFCLLFVLLYCSLLLKTWLHANLTELVQRTWRPPSIVVSDLYFCVTEAN